MKSNSKTNNTLEYKIPLDSAINFFLYRRIKNQIIILGLFLFSLYFIQKLGRFIVIPFRNQHITLDQHFYEYFPIYILHCQLLYYIVEILPAQIHKAKRKLLWLKILFKDNPIPNIHTQAELDQYNFDLMFPTLTQSLKLLNFKQFFVFFIFACLFTALCVKILSFSPSIVRNTVILIYALPIIHYIRCANKINKHIIFISKKEIVLPVFSFFRTYMRKISIENIKETIVYASAQDSENIMNQNLSYNIVQKDTVNVPGVLQMQSLCIILRDEEPVFLSNTFVPFETLYMLRKLIKGDKIKYFYC